MPEQKDAPANTNCPANFTCTNDMSKTGISPASSGYCLSNTAGKQSSDQSVQVGTPIRLTQIQKLHDDIVNDTLRRRLQPKHYTIDAVRGEEIKFDNTLKRIKENLQRITGYELPVNQGDLMRVRDIQDVYTHLNTSEDSCVCVGRCTCNARSQQAGCVCFSVYNCACVSRAGCPSNMSCAQDTRWGCWDCSCNGERGGACCGCNYRGTHGECTCHTDTAEKPPHCTCVEQYVADCPSRCTCDVRTSVECACNIRDVCEAFINN